MDLKATSPSTNPITSDVWQGELCWLVGCHTDIEAADQTFYLT